ncbi:MAG: hypothetical protein SGPRY_011946 [Prymnesium sp.]
MSACACLFTPATHFWQALRSDSPAAISHLVIVVRVINSFCVTRAPGTQLMRFPRSNMTFRGTALPREYREFFRPGMRYRAPMFVATTFDMDVAVHTFLKRLEIPSASQNPPYQEPTLWIFHYDSSLPERKRCVHVNFIGRMETSVENEDEFLFAPFSCFTIRSVCWETSPTVDIYESRPHVIEVDVPPSNLSLPNELPLAPWC